MKGAVILAGGGGTPPEVPQTILKLAGGANARGVILAHVQQDVARGGRRSAEFFAENGAQNVIAPDTLDAGELTAIVREARAVWIPGGDQNRFMERLGNAAELIQAIREVVARGGVAGGTSAGASLMGARMPTGDHSPEGDLKIGASPTAPALGILPNALVDQHFLKRQRLPRLLCALLENPNLTGIGVDEDAWAMIQGKKLTVHRAQVVLARVRGKPRQQEQLLGSRAIQLQVLLPGEQALM
ncbi:MAG: cyanophycinase [Fimbriimonadales bacterium]|nr:cyanophycinase [Fimbriimonadales bacterium]